MYLPCTSTKLPIQDKTNTYLPYRYGPVSKTLVHKQKVLLVAKEFLCKENSLIGEVKALEMEASLGTMSYVFALKGCGKRQN